jgi:hypothetical protein
MNKDTRKILGFPFHPVLFCVYPILYVYTRNIMFIPFDQTYRFLAISLCFTICYLLILRILMKSWDKAGVLTSLLLIQLFSFGQIANVIEQWMSQQGHALNYSILAWLWLTIYALACAGVVKAKVPQNTSVYLNLIGIVLVIFPLTSILSSMTASERGGESENEILSEIRGEAQAVSPRHETPLPEMPDIYYIILDAYTRADVLREFYDYDNTVFLDALEDRGFFIVEESRSNYMNTTYSLNTSLNLLYFHEIPLNIFRQARYDLQTNYVNQFLRDQGYKVVVFDSGTGDTNNQYADIFLSPNPPRADNGHDLNPFEHLMLRTTIALLFYEQDFQSESTARISEGFINSVNHELDVRRERIRFTLNHLSDYATRDGHYFVFAHIYLPHFPFLYGPNQKALEYHQNVNLFWYEVEPENYVEFYGYQLDYLNQALMPTIDSILANTEKPLVIIIQGDHGDEKYLDWDAPDARGVNARSAILNAIYFSDGNYALLYPTMTPVNTFRVIFNKWFDTQYPLLPDRSYFHEHSLSTPYNKKPEFTDICAEFDICLPGPP